MTDPLAPQPGDAADPAFMAYQRALLGQRDQANRSMLDQTDAANRSEVLGQATLAEGNTRSMGGINNAMESRGLFSSGERGSKLIQQGVDYGMQRSALTDSTAQRILAIKSAYEQQVQGMGQSLAEQRLAAADRAAGAASQDRLDRLSLGGGTGGGGGRALSPPQSVATSTIRRVAQSLGVDENLALAIAQQESGYNVRAVGDNGTSFGLYQLHRGGHLGNKSPEWAYDPYNNAQNALTVVASVARQHPNWSPGQIAAAAQRPANPAAYAAAINRILGVG